jgi:hypothetical protein
MPTKTQIKTKMDKVISNITKIYYLITLEEKNANKIKNFSKLYVESNYNFKVIVDDIDYKYKTNYMIGYLNKKQLSTFKYEVNTEVIIIGIVGI